MEFSYVAYTDSKNVVTGKMSAASEMLAEDALVKLGYKIISIKTTKLSLLRTTLWQSGVKKSELVIFSRQFAILIESGISIVRSIELLQDQLGDKELKRVLKEVVNDIRRGDSLSTALEKYPHAFPSMYTKMMAVGEQSGSLETVLKNLADYIEKQVESTNKLKAALTYPAIVFCLAIVVGGIMVTFLLPSIVKLFSSLGGELPLITRILMWSMDWLQHYGLHLLAGILSFVIIFFAWTRTKAGRFIWDTLLLRMPPMGRVIRLNELSRCCNTLSLLFRAGIPLPEALALTAQASRNTVLIQAFKGVENEMRNGEGLSHPMRKRSIFLPLMVEMAKVGEETGNLDTTLDTVSKAFQADADRRTQALLTMVEPVMTIIIGLGVGFLALSVIGPIYSSLSLVGGK